MENNVLTERQQEVFTEESIFIPFHENDLLHLKRFCGSPAGPVIFMLHGSVENGRIFYSKNGKGLAPFLAKEGYDVFVADLRGRGLSTPPINRESYYGLTESIQEEIPCFLSEIKKIRGDAEQHWITHSWGGIMMLCYFARNPKDIPSSMIFFGTKRRMIVGGIRKFWVVGIFYNFIFKIIIGLRGFVDIKRFGIGKENETRKARNQTYEWVTNAAWKDDEDGFDYAKALHKIHFPPALFIAGGNDELLGNEKDVLELMKELRQDHAAFYLAAESNGNKHNYDHITMLTHPDAPEDHFQYVLQWLKQCNSSLNSKQSVAGIH